MVNPRTGILIAALLLVFASGCIQRTAIEPLTLTTRDVLLELKNLERINAHPNNKDIRPNDYPVLVGRYSENGLILIEVYRCSDVCPDYGAVYLIYRDIDTREKCEGMGGNTLIDPAWRSYIGCAPKVG